MNLILNSNQGLGLFRQKRSLGLIDRKIFQKQKNEDFFIQLFNAWIHFTNRNFSNPTPVKESFEKAIFLNLHTKLNFSSDNLYFYWILPRNISDKYNIIRELCRFLKPRLISSTTFDEKLGFPIANRKII